MATMRRHSAGLTGAMLAITLLALLLAGGVTQPARVNAQSVGGAFPADTNSLQVLGQISYQIAGSAAAQAPEDTMGSIIHRRIHRVSQCTPDHTIDGTARLTRTWSGAVLHVTPYEWDAAVSGIEVQQATRSWSQPAGATSWSQPFSVSGRLSHVVIGLSGIGNAGQFLVEVTIYFTCQPEWHAVPGLTLTLLAPDPGGWSVTSEGAAITVRLRLQNTGDTTIDAVQALIDSQYVLPGKVEGIDYQLTAAGAVVPGGRAIRPWPADAAWAVDTVTCTPVAHDSGFVADPMLPGLSERRWFAGVTCLGGPLPPGPGTVIELQYHARAERETAVWQDATHELYACARRDIDAALYTPDTDPLARSGDARAAACGKQPETAQVSHGWRWAAPGAAPSDSPPAPATLAPLTPPPGTLPPTPTVTPGTGQSVAGGLPLLHVGANPTACVGPFAGAASGTVAITPIAGHPAYDLNIAVTGAKPNTTYVVDIRCVAQIGTLTVDGEGRGTLGMSLMASAIPSGPFWIDLSEPGGGGGAGGYGDTFIAGPFALK